MTKLSITPRIGSDSTEMTRVYDVAGAPVLRSGSGRWFIPRTLVVETKVGGYRQVREFYSVLTGSYRDAVVESGSLTRSGFVDESGELVARQGEIPDWVCEIVRPQFEAIERFQGELV